MSVNKLRTPAYIIDETILEKNLKLFEYIQAKTGCKVLLATKAFSCYSVYPLISSYLSGTTNSSYHEAKLSHDYFGKETHIYSPAYIPDDFEKICEVSTSIAFNSIAQYEKYRSKVPAGKEIGLRLNPEHVEVANKMYSPCQPGSRFGVLKSQLENVDISGIEAVLVHALCGNNEDSLERLILAVENKFADIISREHIKLVNFGGGHMISRPGYNVEKCCQMINDFQEKYNVQVILEPGESIVYQSGVLVATVLDVIHNAMDIAIVDCSASAHMPDVLEMPYTPALIGASAPNEKPYTYRIGGNTCLSGDIIGEYSFDQPLKIGDRLIFKDMAQYTMVKNTTFNGVNLPSIYIKRKSGEQQCVNWFGYDDFKSRL